MDKLLDIYDLSEWLGRSPATIKSDLSRCPQTLPPGIKIGREWRWRPEDVIRWIDNKARQAWDKHLGQTLHVEPSPPRRPGRPTKAEEIAKRKC